MHSVQMTIGELFQERARLNPSLSALVGPKRRFTFSEYDQLTNQVAHYLLRHGVKKGDRIALFSETNVIFPLLFLGAAKIGAISVPINWRWSVEVIEWSIQHTEPKLIFYDDAYHSLIASLHLPESMPTVQTSDSHDLDAGFEAEIRSCSASAPADSVECEDPACIIFTSGTTGKPKGAVLTHRNFSTTTVSLNNERKAGLHILCATPLFHLSGAGAVILQSLSGSTCFFLPHLEPSLLLKTIEKEQIHSIFLPPAMLNHLFPHFKSHPPLPSLKVITSGGSPVPPSLIRDYKSIGYPLAQGYGCTESSGIISFWSPEMGFDTCGSVGKPFFNEIKVLDRYTREEVDTGEIGELAVRGPTVFQKYWKDPAATKEVFHQGWLLTGDAVRVDEEGWIYLVDRYKDVIYFSGFDIYPSEVEQELHQMEEISEVSVVGVQHERRGELPCAFVVKKPESTLTPNQVLQFAHDRMDSNKLADVVLIDQLPRNALGKIEKMKLKEMYQPLSNSSPS